jgi:hypothetical protein
MSNNIQHLKEIVTISSNQQKVFMKPAIKNFQMTQALYAHMNNEKKFPGFQNKQKNNNENKTIPER